VLFRNTAGSPWAGIFSGIFVTGGFMFTFAQKIPAWDSSWYPLMMTLNIPYRKYLEAKWWSIVIVTFISMLIGSSYIFLNRELFYGVIAGGFYNIGVNSLLTMISGAYNRTPVDLNSKAKAFGNSNSVNMKTFLLIIPEMVIPVVIYLVIKTLSGVYPAIITIFLIGLAGFLLREKAFDFIVKLYKKEKYSTINAFRKTE
jgi:xanthosine utilization system XapX-like protein